MKIEHKKFSRGNGYGHYETNDDIDFSRKEKWLYRCLVANTNLAVFNTALISINLLLFIAN